MIRTDNSAVGPRPACSYNDDITINEWTSVSISPSVTFTKNSGHIPQQVSSDVSSMAGIMSPTIGTATRLVIRKYFGKVPKYA